MINYLIMITGARIGALHAAVAGEKRATPAQREAVRRVLAQVAVRADPSQRHRQRLAHHAERRRATQLRVVRDERREGGAG